MASAEGEDARESYCFLHLSDVHFGQEKGGQVFINNDIKDELIPYLKGLAVERAEAKLLPIDGMLVTGDIAFSGKKGEYQEAAEWLAKIADAVGCDRTEVHVVPGNHDVDRKAISPGIHAMIDQVMEHGQGALDAYLANERDREGLYERFAEYRLFASGYGCRLDCEGGDAGSKDFQLRNGLKLRFAGMNSALLCRGQEEDEIPGKLFLGDKQRVIPREDGAELIILMHHPISWLADGDAAWTYFKNRARIFISGHEHTPKLHVEKVEGNGKVLQIDSGAIVPPHAGDGYGYTFNIIDIALAGSDDELEVTVSGHIWDAGTTSFRPDRERFGTSHVQSESLPCVRFERFKTNQTTIVAKTQPPAPKKEAAVPSAQPTVPLDTKKFAELRLRYFHKLTPLQRLQILIELEILPKDWNGSTTAALELSALEAVAEMGRLPELEHAINKVETGAENGA